MSLSDYTLLIKTKELSGANLGKMIDTSGDVIGHYDGGDITLSMMVGSKIADTLEVPADYLFGKSNLDLNKQALKRLEVISTLPQEKKIYPQTLMGLARL